MTSDASRYDWSGPPPGQNAARLEQWTTKTACAQIIGRIAISLLACAIHVLLLPSSYAEAPLLALVAFAILVFVRRGSRIGVARLPLLSAGRILVFAACHVLLLAIAFHYGAHLRSAATYSFTGSLLAALKLLILAPTIVLFPVNRMFLRQIAPELMAALVVLLTIHPVRHFQLIWPAYSNLLGAAITHASALLVPSASFAPGTDGVVVAGPAVDLHIEFSCSGVNGVTLFQLVFGMIVAVEWNRIAKLRALICYAGGVLGYLVANFLRLLLVFLSGNLVSHTVNLNVALFALGFMALVRYCYEWMVPPEAIIST
jgi:hypothetical protein